MEKSCGTITGKVWRIPGRRINVVVLKKLIKKLTKEKPVIMGKTVKT
jgi:hypothetical protein